MQVLLQMRNFYLPTLKVTFRRCWENLQTRRKAFMICPSTPQTVPL